MLFRLLIWGEEGSMKDIMDFPVWGKLELVGDWGNLGDYLKRSVSPWGEFGCDVAR